MVKEKTEKTIDKRKLNAELKRLIKNELQRLKCPIRDIKARIRLYSDWTIDIYTDIYNDWYVEDLQTNQIIHLGKISENYVEKWIMENGYNRYRIDWQLSYNGQLEEIRKRIEDLVLKNYGHLIGSYYEDLTNARQYLLIVRVFPR